MHECTFTAGQVFIKSYYVKAGGITRQPIDWVSKNVYQKMVDHGRKRFLSEPVVHIRDLFTKTGSGQT